MDGTDRNWRQCLVTNWILPKSISFPCFPKAFSSSQAGIWGRECLTKSHRRRHPTFCCSNCSRDPCTHPPGLVHLSISHKHPALPSHWLQETTGVPAGLPCHPFPSVVVGQTSNAHPPWHPMSWGGLADCPNPSHVLLLSRSPMISAHHFGWQEGAGSGWLSSSLPQTLPCRGASLIKRSNLELSLHPVWCEAICVPEEEGHIQYWGGWQWGREGGKSLLFVQVI